MPFKLIVLRVCEGFKVSDKVVVGSEYKGGLNIKRILLPFLLITFMLTGCGSSNNMNKIVIGIDDDFPPLSFYNEKGELVGFEIDLAKETAKRMGAKVEFKPINWNEKEEEITSGRIDLIWNGLDITDERKEYMIFSRPYMDDRQILLVKRDSELEFYSEDDLEDKIVGTQVGSTSDEYISKDTTLKDSIREYKTFSKFSEVVAALKADEIDVVVCDELVARYETKTYPNQLKIIDIKMGAIAETGIGFRKDNVKLRDRVQKAFDEVIANGTAKAISLKWFNADVVKHSHKA